MNYRLILLTFLTIILPFQTLSAKKKVKEVKIEGVKGMAIGSDTESMEEVTARAINEAKTEALKRAVQRDLKLLAVSLSLEPPPE